MLIEKSFDTKTLKNPSQRVGGGEEEGRGGLTGWCSGCGPEVDGVGLLLVRASSSSLLHGCGREVDSVGLLLVWASSSWRGALPPVAA